MALRVLAAFVTAALVLVGCSGDDPAAQTDLPSAGSGRLGGLTGEDLCAALDSEAIANDFDVRLAPKPLASTKDHPSTEWREPITCTFMERLPDHESSTDYFSLKVIVHDNEKEMTAKQALEVGFFDGYREVEGLGDLAAYGENVDEDALVVVLERAPGPVTVLIKVPDASLKQLRPFMQAVLPVVKSNAK